MENDKFLKNLKKHFYLLSTHEILKLIEENENEIDILTHAKEILPSIFHSDFIECEFNENEDDYDIDDFKFDEALNDFFTLAKTSVTSEVKRDIEKDLRFYATKRYREENYPNRPSVLKLYLTVKKKDFVKVIKKYVENPVVKLDDFR